VSTVGVAGEQAGRIANRTMGINHTNRFIFIRSSISTIQLNYSI
jgi:hypothetical protein